MPSQPLRLDGLLVKKEVTYGVDPTPAPTTDAVRGAERVWGRITIDPQFPNKRPDAHTGTLRPAPPAKPRGRVVRLDFAVEVRGSGVAYSASVKPEMAALLRACGLSEVIVTTGGSEKITYAPADTAHESVTLWAYGGGMLFKIVGVRGTLTAPFDGGQLGLVRFAMTGMLASVSAAAIPTFTFSAAIPQAAVGMALTVGAWSADGISAEFNLGGDVQINPSVNGADGIGAIEIASFTPTLRLSAKTAPLGTYDPYADHAAAVARALAYTLGEAQYNRLKFAETAGYVNEPAHEEQNGFAGWGLTFDCNNPSLIFD